MGDLIAPEPSSLERLKALDSLPTLETQLYEAQQLCNQYFRAEMISKWLLGKLKTTGNARNNATSWVLLGSCVRLLSKQKVAILFSTNGFVDILHSTCTNHVLPKETFLEVVHLVELLLDSVRGADEAAITSVLSAKSEIAASIYGNWLQIVLEHYPDAAEQLANEWMLAPVLQIWDMRHRSDSDDDLFGHNCLVPTSLLLVALQGVDVLAVHKRKRRAMNELPPKRGVSTLRSLIAKHTILPARAVFLRSQNNASQPRHGGALVSQPTIKERLGPLKMALLSSGSLATSKTIPLLLDIAISSRPLLTSKDRLSEQPWVQDVVAALRSCCVNMNRHDENAILTQMLECVHKHGLALSTQVLARIVEHNALDEAEKADVDWALICKVVDLNPTVFTTSQTLLKTAFDAITAGDRAQASSAQTMASSASSPARLKDNIVLPLLKAFARNRLLTTFTDAWYNQLLQLGCTSEPTMWIEIGESFSDVVEEALSLTQVVDLCNRLSRTVEAWSSSTDEADVAEWDKRYANLVQLHALIAGIRSEELLAKLQAELEGLVQCMCALKMPPHQAPHTSAILCVSSQLLTAVLELWFPLWVAQQSDKAVVSTLGESVMRSELYTAAIEIDTQLDDWTAGASCILVATVGNYFRQYDEDEDCTRLVMASVEHLSGVANTTGPAAFLKYPALLSKLNTTQRQRVFGSFLGVSTISNDLHESLVHGLAAAVLSLEDRSVFDDAISFAVEQLDRLGSSNYVGSREATLLSFFTSMNHTTLKQEQRSAILDAVSQLGPSKPCQNSQRLLQARFSLMSRLLPSARYDVKLLQDASHIFRLAALIDADSPSSVAVDATAREETLHIFGILIKILVDMWVVNKDQQRGYSPMSQLTQLTKDQISTPDTVRALSTQSATFAIVTITMAAQTDHILDAYPEKYIKREGIVQSYLEGLVERLEQYFPATPDHSAASDEGERSVPLEIIINALLASSELVENYGVPQRLAERIKTFVVDYFDTTQKLRLTASDGLAACFRLMIEYDHRSFESTVKLAEHILGHDLDAGAHARVLETCIGCVEDGTDTSKVAAINYLGSRLRHSSASVPLYERLILHIGKDELGERTLVDSAGMAGVDVFMPLLSAISEGNTLHIRKQALQALAKVIRKQPQFLNQNCVEETIATLTGLLQTYEHTTYLYMDCCAVLSSALATQRSRCQGRAHLLISLFQALIAALFKTTKTTTSFEHARALSRLLESFCKPPQTRYRKGKKTSELIDEARKAQAHAGQFVQYILHSYCSQILNNTPAVGVREALLPGVFSIIEAIEVNDVDGIKVLSAAMNHSERAVLRSVYDDWRRSGKWEGL